MSTVGGVLYFHKGISKKLFLNKNVNFNIFMFGNYTYESDVL